MTFEDAANEIHPGRLVPMFYMNLDRSVVRKKFQVEQSIKHNLLLHRVLASTPACQDFRDFVSTIGYRHDRVVDALVFSGYKMMKAALDSKHDFFILSEDDVCFVNKFREKLYRIFCNNKGDVDIFHVGSRGLKNLYRTEDELYFDWPIYRKWRPGKPLYPGSPVCFFTDREGLTKLFVALEMYLKTEEKWEPFDNLLAHLYTQSGSDIKPVIVSKNLCKEGKFPSDRETLEEEKRRGA